MTPNAKNEADFLRNMARCRRFGHKFLLTGRFLGMADVKGDNPPATYTINGSDGGTHTVDIPTVSAAIWEAEDGSIGIVMANISDEDRAVEVTAPLRSGKTYELEAYGPEGRLSISKTQSAVQKVTIPGRGALILSLREK